MDCTEAGSRAETPGNLGPDCCSYELGLHRIRESSSHEPVLLHAKLSCLVTYVHVTWLSKEIVMVGCIGLPTIAIKQLMLKQTCKMFSVSAEPGQRVHFASGEPSSSARASNQSNEYCILRTWMALIHPTNQPLTAAGSSEPAEHAHGVSGFGVNSM